MNKSDFTKSLELNEFCGIILFEIQHKRDENKERKKLYSMVPQHFEV